MSDERTCTWKDCARPLLARGLCQAHWIRQKRGKPMDAPLAGKGPRPVKPCGAIGCYRPVNAHGLCRAHEKRKERGLENWNTPLRDWAPKETTAQVFTRLPPNVKAALQRQASAHGYSMRRWVRAILERQVAELLKGDVERVELLEESTRTVAEEAKRLGPYSGRAA